MLSLKDCKYFMGKEEIEEDGKAALNLLYSWVRREHISPKIFRELLAWWYTQ